MPSISQTNLNVSFVTLTYLIEQLGVSQICIAPGSRSTPLALAADKLAELGKIDTHIHFDERGLGFFALGMAKQQKKAVAIVTTSGSAVANLLPSVVEAYYQMLPIILITADRPPEHIDVGANQAIDQVNIFGKYAHAINLPCPDHNKPLENDLESFLGKIIAIIASYGHEAALSNKKLDLNQPLHINMPFREPMYASDMSLSESFMQKVNSQIAKAYSPVANINLPIGNKTLSIENKNVSIANPDSGGIISKINDFIDSDLGSSADRKFKGNVLLIIAENPDFESDNQFEDYKSKIIEFSEALNLPVLVNGLSRLRTITHQNFVYHFDFYLDTLNNLSTIEATFQPDVVIWVGHRLVSQSLYSWLPKTAKILQIHNYRHAIDPYEKNVTHIQAKHLEDLNTIFGRLKTEKASLKSSELQTKFLNAWMGKDKSMKEKLNALQNNSRVEMPRLRNDQVRGLAKPKHLPNDKFCGKDEFSVMNSVIKGAIEASTNNKESFGLFLGNSSPIRLFSNGYVPNQGDDEAINSVWGNRGCSGIDGNIATIAGIAAHSKHSWHLAVMGDLTFLHDVNSLALLRDAKNPVIIVVFNNNGGGIFSWLPVHENKSFTPLFKTPQKVNINDMCSGLYTPYFKYNDEDSYREILEGLLTKNTSAVIEIETNSEVTGKTIRILKGNQLK